jgi:replicative DNA helicase
MFASIKGENKLLKSLISHDTIDQQIAIKNIEKVINSNISPEHFTTDFRAWLFSSIISHYYSYSAALTIDLTHQKIVKTYKKEQSINDANALLEKVINRLFDQLELEPTIDELKNLHQLRKVFDVTQSLLTDLKAIKEGTKDVNATPLITKLDSAIEQLNSQSTMERIIEEDAFQDINGDIASIQDRHDNPEKYKGIDTGIEPLTLATSGWQGGDLVTVIGRTGHGKSIVLLNFGYSAWITGEDILYVTIEMPIGQQKRRLHSRMTGVPYFRMKNADKLTNEELIYIEKKIKEIKSKHDNSFVILDAPSACNANFIKKRIYNYEKSTGKKIKLVIVDPIYLMQPNEHNEMSKKDPVGAISWDLKLLARELDVPVLTANQISREGNKRHLQGREIDTMDSSSSDRLGQNSDIMLGIISDDLQWLKMTIVKYRDGKGPTLFLRRKFDVMKVEYDVEYNQHDEIISQIMGTNKEEENE